MKLLHVSAYYPPHLGGMEAVVENLARRLAARGHDLTVLTSNIPRTAAKTVHEKTRVRRLPAWEFAHTAIIPSLLSEVLDAEHGTIIHVHIAQAFIPEVCALAAKLRGLPYIAHVHLDVDPSGPLGFLLPAYKKLALGPVLRNATRVLVPTEAYATRITQRYRVPRECITVVPNAATLNFPAPRHESSPGARALHRPLRLLAVGRLAAQKNYPLLLRACTHLTSPYTLTIAGSGEDEAKLRALATSLGIDRSITWRGRLEGRALRDAYQNADIYVQTSHDESFSLTTVEAMAAGLPTVSTDIPAVREVTGGEAALLVKPDERSISNALLRLARDGSLRRRLKRSATQRAKHYQWDAIVPLLEQVYASIQSEEER